MAAPRLCIRYVWCLLHAAPFFAYPGLGRGPPEPKFGCWPKFGEPIGCEYGCEDDDVGCLPCGTLLGGTPAGPSRFC